MKTLKFRKLYLGSKENFWNDKYPKVVIMYKGRMIPNYGMYELDVRSFFTNPVANELQQIVQGFSEEQKACDDQKALTCLEWVMDNIYYVSDKKRFDLPEFWLYPSETLKLLGGDCEDGAILLVNLMRVIGIPYWKIRLTAGLVFFLSGHAYVNYFCEELDHWVLLDWCYHPNRKPVNKRPDYKDEKLYNRVWFSFNQRYSFAKGVKETGKAVRFADLTALPENIEEIPA